MAAAEDAKISVAIIQHAAMSIAIISAMDGVQRI